MAARNHISGDAVLRSIKPGHASRRINDGDGQHLLLFVKGGSHGWRFEYSFKGKRNNISLGTYPDVTLAMARKRADEARRQVADGLDPSAVRKMERSSAADEQEKARRADAGLPQQGSFEDVAREWLTTIHAAKVSPGHADRTRIRLEQDAFPWIGRATNASAASSVTWPRLSYQFLLRPNEVR